MVPYSGTALPPADPIDIGQILNISLNFPGKVPSLIMFLAITSVFWVFFLLFSLLIWSVYFEGHGDNVLDPSLQLIMLLHR